MKFYTRSISTKSLSLKAINRLIFASIYLEINNNNQEIVKYQENKAES